MQGAAALLAASVCIYALEGTVCILLCIYLPSLCLSISVYICTLGICTYATYVCSLVLVCRYMVFGLFFVPALFLPLEPRHGRALQFLSTELRADKEAPGPWARVSYYTGSIIYNFSCIYSPAWAQRSMSMGAWWPS